jgi:hypothetical protein
MFAFPATPVLFLLINVWIMYFIVQDRPQDMYVVSGILIAGIIAWVILHVRKKRIQP